MCLSKNAYEAGKINKIIWFWTFNTLRTKLTLWTYHLCVSWNMAFLFLYGGEIDTWLNSNIWSVWESFDCHFYCEHLHLLFLLWHDNYIYHMTSFTCACSACLRVRFWFIVSENTRVKFWRLRFALSWVLKVIEFTTSDISVGAPCKKLNLALL